jgi:hypothetical protein
MAEYLAPALIQRHFPQRFEELPPAIFLEHYFIFPVVVIIAAVALVWQEWTYLPYLGLQKILDTVIAGAVLVFFVLYRIVPPLAKRLHEWRGRWREARKVSSARRPAR